MLSLCLCLWVCTAYGKEDRISGKKLAAGKKDELALSYREQQLCYRHHLPFLFFVEVQSSGKLSVKAVSVLKSVETF